MVSFEHEALLQLVRNQPTLVVSLLEQALGIVVPQFATASLEDITLNDVTPAEYRSDTVVVLRDELQRPVLAVVVEVQLRRDGDKPWVWPVYAVELRARLRCRTELLVVTPDPKTATWANQSFEIGACSTFQPLVVGPDLVPRVTDAGEARQNSELAVLSVLAHGHSEEGGDIAGQALHAVEDLDAERSTFYTDLILSALPVAARLALEELMKIDYEYQSDFAKKYFGQGREQGLEKGLEQGREEGLENVRSLVSRQLRQLGLTLDPATATQLASAALPALESIADELVTPSENPVAKLEAIARILSSGQA